MNTDGRSGSSPSSLSLTGWWLLGCAYLSVAGWVLSAAGQLDTLGYGIALAIGITAALLWARPWHGVGNGYLRLGRALWRFRNPLPLLFLLYAILALLGGALYAPANYDALTYRLPRVLHWLAEQRWHWIPTINMRMNISASGFEWLMAPMVAVARSDRPLFLLNIVAYFLMPGMIYGAFTRLGVNPRVAWYWMWLLPAGYCYVAEAGSIGNDMIGAVYLLAALHYTLRARTSGRLMDLALGVIAAALMTGVKASNLPLLLPWAVAALGSLQLIRARPVLFSALALLFSGISFLPIAGANLHYTGDWTGDPQNHSRMKIQNPVYGVLGNSLMLLSTNVAPPVMPIAGAVDEELNRQLQSPFFRNLERHFPRFGLGWAEVAQEEGAGMGVGLSCLLVVTAIAASLRRREQLGKAATAQFALSAHRGSSLIARRTGLEGVAVCLSAWAALVAYMATMGSEAAGRLVAPYYPLLFASALLLPKTVAVVRRTWWKAGAFAAALSALPALILSTTRPLWPAETVCRILEERMPGNRLVDRAAMVYAVYAARSDALGTLRKYLPAGAKTIGFLGTENEPETALWRPFGTRRVVDITPENEEQPLGRDVSAIVVSADGVQETYRYSLEHWLQQRHAHVLGREKLIVTVARGPEDWAVISGLLDPTFGP
jgi:hypothetical protein